MYKSIDTGWGYLDTYGLDREWSGLLRNTPIVVLHKIGSANKLQVDNLSYQTNDLPRFEFQCTK